MFSQDISFNSNKLGEDKQKNNILRHVLEDFAQPALNLRPSRVGKLDILGDAYEFLIGNFAAMAGKKAGEFLYAAGGVRPHGSTAWPPGRRRDLRPGLRFGLVVDEVRTAYPGTCQRLKEIRPVRPGGHWFDPGRWPR